MDISKIKLVFTALTGGFAGVVKYLLTAFNTQVLGRITDKEHALVYLKDVKAASALVSAILSNHSASFSDQMKTAITSVIDALSELANALADFNIDEDEFDSILAKTKASVQAIKDARKAA